MRKLICFFLIGLASVGLGYAGTITVVSGDATNEGNCATFPCAEPSANIPIAPADPVWYVPAAGGSWVTHSDTPPDGSTSGPARIFFETFSLPGSINTGSINVWADDTADVWLIGPGGAVQLANAVLTSDDGCAAGIVGCEADEFLAINAATLAAGNYTLRIDTYQLASNTPFGVLYEGSIDSVIPEPGTLSLLCIGGLLLAAGRIFKRA